MYQPSISRPRFRTGLGALSPGAQTAEAIAAAGASTTVGILVSLGTIAGPVGAAIGGLIAIAPLIANLFSGCGQICIAATNVTNPAADLLTKNLNAYINSPIRTRSMQAAALNNFDTLWNAYVQAIGQIPKEGAIYLAERQRAGASGWGCKCPNSTRVADSACANPPCCTGCDWFFLFRDPIANDPAVQPDPVSQAESSLLSAAGINPNATVAGIPVSKLLLPAAAAALLWWWNS